MKKLSVARVQVPSGMVLYRGDGSAKTLPPPGLNTLVSILDSRLVRFPLSELELKLVKWVEKNSMGWTMEKLCEQVKKYPGPLPSEVGMER